jgi:hypothetical protein
MTELSEEQVIDKLADKLVHIYPTVEPNRISRVVRPEYARFRGGPVRDFIPLLVERHAKEEITKLIA